MTPLINKQPGHDFAGCCPTGCPTVVILHNPYKENNPNSRTFVIPTNGPVNKPFKAYDAYDVRSEIENSLFREAEQAWFIQSPSRHTKTDFRVREVGADESCIAKLNRLPSIVFSSIK